MKKTSMIGLMLVMASMAVMAAPNPVPAGSFTNAGGVPRGSKMVMDITMKVKDGLEAAREILAADPNARIVMVTALGQEKMLLDSIALGVRDFVVKPFTKERILSAVEKALH